MAVLTLSLLGAFRVTLEGQPLTQFRTRKVQALLIYLAMEGAANPIRRELLMTLLWPSMPQSSAQLNLRQVIYHLRKILPPARLEGSESPQEFLLVDAKCLQVNPDYPCRVDVRRFNALLEDVWRHDHLDLLACAACQERLQEAATLYQGDFLADFYLDDSNEFEEWAATTREASRRKALDALEALATVHTIKKDYLQARLYAERQLGIDNLRESAYRQLMEIMAFSGQRSEALAQYETCRKVLKKELGAEPSGETARLYEQILAGQLEASAPAIRITTTHRPPAYLEAFNKSVRSVFVAREQELGQLSRFLEGVLSGKGRLAFVTGGAGRGKTALLREFARQASDAHPDLLVAAGSCNPYSGVCDPYLPLRSVLRILMGNLELAGSTGMIDRAQARSLSQAMPQALHALISSGNYLVDTFIPGSELLLQAESSGEVQSEFRRFVEQAANKPYNLAQQHLFEQYCAVLRALSRDYPLLLLLDDLQWADSASAGLLYHLGARLEGSRILVLGAYRPEEVALGHDGDRHPLEKALAEFKRLYGDAWLDLTHSDERGGRNFVDAFLDSQPNRLAQAFREQLFQHTEGHALFTIELLRAMQERGDLVKDQDGCWIEMPVLDWESLPARVEAIIAERIGRLDEVLRQTLSIASVEGEDFTAQVVARVQKVNENKLLHELSQELEKRHRLVREQGELQIAQQTLSRYRFAHALHQQYLYNHLGSAERRLLHGATAQALEALYADEAAKIAPQLAHHWQQAREREKARGYLLLAGQEALAAFANLIAERYFRQALELEPTEAQRAALLAGLGEALRRQAQREEAVPVMRQGIDLYRQLGDPDGMANLYCGLSLVLWQDNYLDAWNTCQAGLQQLEGAPDSLGLARLLAEAGRTAYFMEDATSEDLCRRAIGMAERLGVLEARAEASITLAMIIDNGYGKYIETIQMLEQTIPFCETHGLWSSAARAHMNLGVWLDSNCIDTHSACQHYLQGAKIKRKIGDVDGMFVSLQNAAAGFTNLGNLTSMESMLAEFLQRSSAPKGRIRQFLEERSNDLLFYRGEWAQACEYHRACREDYRNRQIFPGIIYNNLVLAATQIELHRLTGSGDLAEAEAALLENLEIGEFNPGNETRLVKIYSLQNRFAEAHALLAELFKAPAKNRLEARAIHALAERRWNQAASVTLSFINLLQTLGRRWEWARAIIDLGDIYAQRSQPGDIARAREAYQESLAMFSEMEATGYIRVLHQRLQALSLH